MKLAELLTECIVGAYMEKFTKITKISPFISTANIGDYIIQDYCDEIFSELFGDYLGICVPSREKVSKNGAKAILSSDFAFVCGTNLLTSDMLHYRAWGIDLQTPYKIASAELPRRKLYQIGTIRENLKRFHIILLGAGWGEYQKSPTFYTRKVLIGLLDRTMLHAVRDSYTEQKLKEIGIHNVINTACPTMWHLTEEFCSRIPHKKQNIVVTTLTDYRRDEKRDRYLLDLLLSSYQTVYLWLQSFDDMEYLRQLGYAQCVKIIPPTLKCYDDFLQNSDADYIGTRLHGGIRALNYKKRACIIGVDNRAVEIAKDTGLPMIKREELDSFLRDWIESEQPTCIRIPSDNIRKWKAQFLRG